jgi:Cupin-like domain
MTSLPLVSPEQETASQPSLFPPVERRSRLSREELYESYIGKKSVVISGLTEDWPAVSLWDGNYFRELAGNLRVKVKPGYIPKGETEFLDLDRYVQIVDGYEREIREGGELPPEPPAYLHDIPMLAMLPRLVEDVKPFPVDFLPRWYRPQWWRFAQFFFGPTHSLTPLHFDTLGTHNLFFQVRGRKRFIIISSEDRERCYLYSWRWAAVDPEHPDFQKHPLFEKVQPQEALLGPGDVLYMPPGTLHHVRGLDMTISFNIDWHTRRSAYSGMAGVLRGMPWKNFYYNAVAAFGLTTGISSKTLYPLYRSYLDYIS